MCFKQDASATPSGLEAPVNMSALPCIADAKTPDKLEYMLRTQLSSACTIHTVDSVTTGGTYSFARMGDDWQVCGKLALWKLQFLPLLGNYLSAS